MLGNLNFVSFLASTTSHADAVTLNPQPLPPRVDPLAHGFEDGLELDRSALNPQPLPPKPAPDPEPWSFAGFFAALLKILR